MDVVKQSTEGRAEGRAEGESEDQSAGRINDPIDGLTESRSDLGTHSVNYRASKTLASSMNDPRYEAAGDQAAVPENQADLRAQRRSGADRRGQFDRRRSTQGLFERRALREGVTDDRRRRDRREQAFHRIRSLFGFSSADDSR